MVIKTKKTDNKYKLIIIPNLLFGLLVVCISLIIYLSIEYIFFDMKKGSYLGIFITFLSFIGTLISLIVFMFIGGFYYLNISYGIIKIYNRSLINKSFLLDDIEEVLFIKDSRHRKGFFLKLKLNDGNIVDTFLPSMDVVSSFIPGLGNIVYKYELSIAQDIANFAGADLLEK